jgi:alginate O-acetyltransferase complex protein AlgI
MVFSSPVFFFVYLPAFFFFYFVFPVRWRNWFALAGSAFFYLLGAGSLTAILIFLILFNYFFARLLTRTRNPESAYHHLHGTLLTVGVAIDLTPLIFFKYLSFLTHVVDDAVGMHVFPALVTRRYLLPLGISFYTFHCISYLVDVYHHKVKAEERLGKFALYVFLFPHLIAGPIVRYAELRPYLSSEKRRGIRYEIFWGLVLFIMGFAKKVLIADPLGAVVDTVYGHAVQVTTFSSWFAAICYSFQIYFDFSGYTDMAIGLARIMGFKFPHNFNRPYACSKITDFWQRWHMTLTHWFRDYVYYSLNFHISWRGHNLFALATYRNLLIVFVLCGLWHGAAYTFLIWGLGHGLLLVLERAKLVNLSRLRLGPLPAFAIVTMLWVPFRSKDVVQMKTMLKAMFSLDSSLAHWSSANLALLDPKTLALLAVAVLICLSPDRVFTRIKRRGYRYPLAVSVGCLLLYMWSCVSVVDYGFNPFIYFTF